MVATHTLIQNMSRPILWSELIGICGNDYFHKPKTTNIVEINELLENYFNLCESEGFSDKYWNPNSRYHGNSFIIISRYRVLIIRPG